jgi:putative sigma-54 modulation protein
MQISITERHPGITAHVKEYAQKKVNRLERYFDGTQRVEIVLDKDGDDSDVELIVSATGRKIVSEAKHHDLYAAIDLTLDKAEKQLVRYKEKLKQHRDKHAADNTETPENEV